jgi:hypothetical protein
LQQTVQRRSLSLPLQKQSPALALSFGKVGGGSPLAKIANFATYAVHFSAFFRSGRALSLRWRLAILAKNWLVPPILPMIFCLALLGLSQNQKASTRGQRLLVG